MGIAMPAPPPSGEGLEFGLAEWIALGALLVAAASALWQLQRELRWERPVVHVIDRMESRFDQDSLLTGEIECTANVVNVGAVATTIVDVYVQVERPDGEYTYVAGSMTTFDGDFAEHPGLLGHYGVDLDPSIPFALERNQVAVWENNFSLVDLDRDGDVEAVKDARARWVVVYVDRPRRRRRKGPLEPVTRTAVSSWERFITD